MSEIIIRADDYIGAILHRGQWGFYHTMLSMWVLEYAKWEDYTPQSETDWRYGIIYVDENNADDYIKELVDCYLTLEQIPYVKKSPDGKQEPLSFVVDFDKQIFVNGWYDMLPMHTYVPDHWTKLRDSAYEYIPKQYVKLWQ